MKLKSLIISAAVAFCGLAAADLAQAAPSPTGPATVGGGAVAPAAAMAQPGVNVPIPPRPTRLCAAGYTGPTRLAAANPTVYACVRNSQRLVGTPVCETGLLAQRPYADRNNHNRQTYMCIPMPN